MSEHAIDRTASTPPAWTVQLRGAIVAASIRCRRCGYDLQGLAADGRCPECGLPLAETIGFLVDPDASRLPRLASPRVVGASLFRITTLLAASALLVMAIGAWRWLGLSRVELTLLGGLVLPDHLPLVASALGALAVWPVLRLRPPVHGASVADVRDVRTLALGAAGWALAAAALPAAGGITLGGLDLGTVAVELVLLAFAAAVLHGLGSILSTVGDRSRAYRRSRAGRQSTQAMLGALAGVAIGLILNVVAVRADRAGLGTIASIVVLVCCLMAAIGLPYLAINTWWIRNALRRPYRSLDQILLPSLPQDAAMPGDADDEPSGSR